MTRQIGTIAAKMQNRIPERVCGNCAHTPKDSLTHPFRHAICDITDTMVSVRKLTDCKHWEPRYE